MKLALTSSRMMSAEVRLRSISFAHSSHSQRRLGPQLGPPLPPATERLPKVDVLRLAARQHGVNLVRAKPAAPARQPDRAVANLGALRSASLPISVGGRSSIVAKVDAEGLLPVSLEDGGCLRIAMPPAEAVDLASLLMRAAARATVLDAAPPAGTA